MTEQAGVPAVPGVTRWRKKPIEITAIQFTGGNVNEIWDAFGAAGIYGPTEKNPDYLILTTVHGDEAPARAGDWIIPDAAPDTFYPCKPDVFARTYEPAGPESHGAGTVPEDTAHDLTTALVKAQERARGAESERDGARAKLLEYENAITWGTSCLSCSRILDSAYTETVRREAAEAKLAAIRAACASIPSPVADRLLAIAGTGEGEDRG